MIKDKRHGEYAFPTGMNADQGMTLRDYFAAKTIEALLSVRDFVEIAEDIEREKNVNAKDFLARVAYAQADAMLNAREMPKEDLLDWAKKER